MISFWQFLKREFQLANADVILRYLEKISHDYFEIMNDLSKYGMAKSLIMMGHEAGFDMSNQADAYKFMAFYNQQIAAMHDQDYSEEKSHSATSFKTPKSRNKKLRKAARASRKKDRKRK